MHILVIDGGHIEAEFRAKFGAAHEYSFFSSDYASQAEQDHVSPQIRATGEIADVAFCFESAQSYRVFIGLSIPVFAEASCNSLVENLHWEDDVPNGAPLFGFCGLPTFINRPLLEVSCWHDSNRQKLAETCAALGTDYRVVADRVGLVTPRVICQIINEACFTVQEGTATMQDVDLGMKLGTNYPHGPFAWANAIGVERVYAVLEAMWHDTHDERYKVCPLLKRQALLGQSFGV